MKPRPGYYPATTERCKSAARIHAQAVDLLKACSGNHDRMERIIRVHNRYTENICHYFGVTHSGRLKVDDYERPVARRVYVFTRPAVSCANYFDED